MATLALPEALLKFTAGQQKISFPAASTHGFIAELQKNYPDLFKVLFDQNNILNGFVNIYLNQHLLIDRLTEDTLLKETDLMEAVVAVSGG